VLLPCQEVSWQEALNEGILAKRCDVLSPRMVHVIEDLARDWRCLDERNRELAVLEAARAHLSGAN
jgi:hypothetical protein